MTNSWEYFFQKSLKDRESYVKFKNFINDPLVKSVIRNGSEIAAAIAGFSEDPTIWKGLKTAFSIGKTFVDHLEIYAHDYFENDDIWMEPFPRDFTGAILKVIRKYPCETLKTSSEGMQIYLVNIEGAGKVGWIANTRNHNNYRINCIYAETDKIDVIRAKIKSLLWDQFKGKPLVLRRNMASFRSLDEDKIVLEIDDAFHPLPSKLADTCVKYLSKAIENGVNRSLMLYGPPGTGKSTMARKLVNDLNLRSFRIRIEDVGGLESNVLFEAISIFKPDAIILDDFDRAGGQEQLLETLEHFQRHIKLVIATVNRRNHLDEALLRPGRFDEMLLVKRMDDNVIKSVLGDDNQDVFNKVKEWPIAFIQEYVKRRKFMSKKEAMQSIKELAERVERLSKYDDKDADEFDLLKIVGKRAQKEQKEARARVEEDLAKVRQMNEMLGDDEPDPLDDE